MTEINKQPAATGSDNHKPHSDTPLWPLREGERLPTLFWIILSVLLLLTLVSNLIVHIHGYFDCDGLIGFYAAFGFPNLFRRLFAEGAFNSAFVPLFAKEVEGGGLERARQFAEQVLAMLSAVLIGLSALAMIFMPSVVATVVAPLFADTPDKFAMTVDMTRIMFPYLFCMSLVAMFSGILNSLRRYFLAALAPVLLNVAMIAALIAAMERRHSRTSPLQSR